MADSDITLRIRADMDQAQRELARLRRDLGQLGKSPAQSITVLDRAIGGLSRGVSGLAGAAAGAAAAMLSIAGASAAISAIAANTIDAESAASSLAATLRATGGAAGVTSEQIATLAGDLQKVSTFGDDAIVAASALLATFTNVRGDTFTAALTAAVDVSAKLGQELPQTVEQIGRALNQPADAARSLRAINIQLTDSQTDLIDKLLQTGRGAEAQAEILKIITGVYGGAAAAARDTLGGALAGLKNAFGDLLEVKGGLPEAKSQLEGLTSILQNPQTVSAADKFLTLLISGFANVVSHLPEIVRLIERIITLATNAGPALKGLAIAAGALGGVAAGAATGAVAGSLIGPVGTATGAIVGGVVGGATALGAGLLVGTRATLPAPVPGTSSVFLPGQTGKPAATAPTPPKQEFKLPGSAASGGRSAARTQADEIQRIIDKLREEADTYGMTAAQEDIYRLRKLGASEATIAQAQTLADQIAALEDEKKSAEESAKAQERRREEIERARQADADLIASMQDEIDLMRLSGPARDAEIAARRLSAEATAEQRDQVRDLAMQLDAQRAGEALTQSLMTAQERYNAELSEYFNLLNRGAISSETFERAVEASTKRLEASTNEMSQFAIQAARNMQTAFADYLFDPFSKGLDGMLLGFVDVIRRMLAEALAARIGEALFGSLATGQGTGLGAIGGLLAPIFHGGGVAGDSAAQTRSVPAIAWAAAPRYHGGGLAGFRPDEVPAILQRGEEILPAGDPRHRNNIGTGGPPVINLRNVNLFDTGVISDYLASSAGERVILNVVRRNRELLA